MQMQIKEKEIVLVRITEGTNADDVVVKISKIRKDQSQILTDDNGADPDGPLWIVPEYDLDDEVQTNRIPTEGLKRHRAQSQRRQPKKSKPTESRLRD